MSTPTNQCLDHKTTLLHLSSCSERELLELAAVAAGVSVVWVNYVNCMCLASALPHYVSWNPLNDDGDALRLAVSAQLRVLPPESEFGLDRASVRVPGVPELVDAFHTDPLVATRRAIVYGTIVRGLRRE